MLGLSQDNTVHLLLGAIGLGWFVVQLFMNTKLGDIRLLIMEGSGKLDAHIAADAEKHDALDKHLESTDKTVEWLRGRV